MGIKKYESCLRLRQKNGVYFFGVCNASVKRLHYRSHDSPRASNIIQRALDKDIKSLKIELFLGVPHTYLEATWLNVILNNYRFLLGLRQLSVIINKVKYFQT